ncbi:hypothetical protein [Nostoc sp.]|uniref:hypothetical protein n=1 Tax=Nostoc sp. TaxID=1180 RepID=UPI002FFBBF5B
MQANAFTMQADVLTMQADVLTMQANAFTMQANAFTMQANALTLSGITKFHSQKITLVGLGIMLSFRTGETPIPQTNQDCEELNCPTLHL